MSLEPQVLADFEHYFILYKPRSWFVHPPENRCVFRQYREQILTNWLKFHFPFRCHPVHRLDFATEGILVWAKSSEAAGRLSALNTNKGFKKIYHGICRGAPQPYEGLIEVPLLTDTSPGEVPCKTEYKTLQTLVLPHFNPTPKFPQIRYSWMEMRLHTGRWHQIRRHFNRIAHPLIGDREHGDSHHNRFFRDQLQIPGLLLKAYGLEFQDPWTQENRHFLSPVTERWQSLEKLFGPRAAPDASLFSDGG